MNDDLNYFQKKRIEERLKLNFEEELIKSSNSKQREIFNNKFKFHLDLLITELYNNGVLFYGVTIIMPFLDKKDKDLWYYTHLQIENLISFLKIEIELIEFCYFSIELHKAEKKEKKMFIKNNKVTDLVLLDNTMEGVPHFHGIIGVRSLIGKNENHFNEIRKILNINSNDTLIKKLSTIKAIKDHWNFVIKEKNFKFHRFTQYSNYYNDRYCEIADLELQYDDDHFAFGLDENLDSKYNNLSGIKTLKCSQQTIINYLINIYMNINDYYLNDNNIYIKIKESKYSWEIYNSIEYLQKNNITIFEKLKKLFPQQLSYLHISELFNQTWDKFYDDIKKKNHYLPYLEFNESILEFTDGLYFLDLNYFYNFSKNNNKLNLKCLNYFNVSYRESKKKLPFMWLECLSKTLGNQDILQFCTNLGRFLSGKNKILFDKNKNSLCIIGESIQEKAILIINILNKFIEIENIGIISNIASFAFEPNENIEDILKYNKGEQNNFYRNQKFINRLLIYMFLYKIKRADLNNILKKELPQIIIYCNNLCQNIKKKSEKNARNKKIKELKKSLSLF